MLLIFTRRRRRRPAARDGAAEGEQYAPGVYRFNGTDRAAKRTVSSVIFPNAVGYKGNVVVEEQATQRWTRLHDEKLPDYLVTANHIQGPAPQMSSTLIPNPKSASHLPYQCKPWGLGLDTRESGHQGSGKWEIQKPVDFDTPGAHKSRMVTSSVQGHGLPLPMPRSTEVLYLSLQVGPSSSRFPSG